MFARFACCFVARGTMLHHVPSAKLLCLSRCLRAARFSVEEVLNANHVAELAREERELSSGESKPSSSEMRKVVIDSDDLRWPD